jgi:hypothetical protein
MYRSGELICEAKGKMGESLFQCITAAGLFIDAPCGGKGKCGKCLVRLGSPIGEQVAACKTLIEGDMKVYLPDEMEMKIANSGVAEEVSYLDIPLTTNKGGALGVAIDIGTTTVVTHLTDLNTGARLATASGVNAQRPYGADVISRIQYCAENGHTRLTLLIRDQIESLIRHICTISGERSKDIVYISIAANTIMQHLAAGFSPVGMGIAPFEPVSFFGDEHPAWDSLPVSRTCKVYYAPAISSYVGGDITAGDVVVIVYEGPKGGPGMQEMLYPTSYIKAKGLGKTCALITDGRFSGGTSGLSIGHVSPEAASGGNIGLVRDGDIIEIDIPARSIHVRLSDEELAVRREIENAKGAGAWKPVRDRKVSKALQAYAGMVSSADKGGVRGIGNG